DSAARRISLGDCGIGKWKGNSTGSISFALRIDLRDANAGVVRSTGGFDVQRNFNQSTDDT
ncbi:MAG TPA: hypothetical protein VFE79_12555, partial [Paraburkholderia sp.]|nr:hypothetical protein [Paraburkholderia sp.]